MFHLLSQSHKEMIKKSLNINLCSFISTILLLLLLPLRKLRGCKLINMRLSLRSLTQRIHPLDPNAMFVSLCGCICCCCSLFPLNLVADMSVVGYLALVEYWVLIPFQIFIQPDKCNSRAEDGANSVAATVCTNGRGGGDVGGCQKSVRPIALARRRRKRRKDMTGDGGSGHHGWATGNGKSAIFHEITFDNNTVVETVMMIWYVGCTLYSHRPQIYASKTPFQFYISVVLYECSGCRRRRIE